uniref:Uncharacterized protein n=1 Tax=Oryza sativa subsp. japonica TaxID=39947 RepID=Q6YX65_ORYSJ|nr:hypothetical protein [Oryza sativa Japonica Group]
MEEREGEGASSILVGRRCGKGRKRAREAREGDETNLFKTSPTEKNFNSGVGEKSKTEYYPLQRAGPFCAAVNPEADQPDTPADPTPSRPPSPGYVG